MKVKGYCEDCPIVENIEKAIRSDEPGLDEAIIEAKTEKMISEHGKYLLEMCKAKNGYGIVDIRESAACNRITNKDGDMV
jgi:hypothetical protein